MHPRRADRQLFFGGKEMRGVVIAVVHFIGFRHVLLFDKDDPAQQVTAGEVFGHGDMGGHAK